MANTLNIFLIFCLSGPMLLMYKWLASLTDILEAAAAHNKEAITNINCISAEPRSAGLRNV